MTKGFFITGTDTDIGKTEVSLALMQALQQQGKVVNAMKPISAGCRLEEAQLLNEDAERLQAQSSLAIDYSTLNPYAFEPAIAPHIAAQEAGVEIDLNVIKARYDEIGLDSDYVIVEGAGGFCVPINKEHTMVDLAKQLNLLVIMVVGIRLGCINHALLTYQSIENSGLKCVAWVANTVDAHMVRSDENYQAIRERIACPCIAQIPYQVSLKTEDICSLLDLSKLS